MSLTDSVVYQICPKSFRDSSGDGVGDLRGIIEKVDYIASLGVDHVWFNNRTFTEHKWFQRALAGDSVYQDYYYLLPPKEDGSLPTNWVSKFAGPASALCRQPVGGVLEGEVDR